MIDVATHLVLFFAACIEDGSTFTIVGRRRSRRRPGRGWSSRSRTPGPGRAARCPCRCGRSSPPSDGSHPDGSGRGTYADGRFFAERALRRGPAPRPHDRPPAQRAELRAPGAGRRGEGGPTGTAPGAAAPLVRAGGAGLVRRRQPRPRPARRHGRHPDRPGVHGAPGPGRRAELRHRGRRRALPRRRRAAEHADVPLPPRPELRPGPFVGHLNTPGLSRPIEEEVYARLVAGPLPAQRIAEEVHRRGGAVIHTHPLTPPHQMHWMGAAEVLSDAVLGRCADALDVDGQASELLWFAVLNLGNRVACSSYTDCALGRRSTPSPGDRRVYCRAEALTYPAVVEAIRQGRTFATNGGPVFPFVTIDGQGPGETLEPGGDRPHAVRAEVHSLYPLKSARLYRQGEPVETFDGGGAAGRGRPGGHPPRGARRAGLVRPAGRGRAGPLGDHQPDLRRAGRALAAPVRLGHDPGDQQRDPLRRAAPRLLRPPDRHGRRPEDRLESVELLRDGRSLRRFTPGRGRAGRRGRSR